MERNDRLPLKYKLYWINALCEQWTFMKECKSTILQTMPVSEHCLLSLIPNTNDVSFNHLLHFRPEKVTMEPIPSAA